MVSAWKAVGRSAEDLVRRMEGVLTVFQGEGFGMMNFRVGTRPWASAGDHGNGELRSRSAAFERRCLAYRIIFVHLRARTRLDSARLTWTPR